MTKNIQEVLGAKRIARNGSIISHNWAEAMISREESRDDSAGNDRVPR